MLLITGATGFIGRALSTYFIEKGEDLRILSRNPDQVGNKFPMAEIIKGDILDPASLKPAMKDISSVIHLAGLISYTLPREDLFRMNVSGTNNVLEAAKEVDRFLFSSSVSIYGETKTKVDEDSPPSPRNFYGESKLAAEKAILNSGIPAVALRLSVVFGIGSPIWKDILTFFGKGFPIPKTRNLINIIHISDVARAFDVSLKKGKGVYNIAGEKSFPFLELVSLLAYHLNLKPKFWPPWLVHFLARLKGKHKDIEAFIINRDYAIDKARRELGFTPEAYLEKELKLMVEWFQKL